MTNLFTVLVLMVGVCTHTASGTGARSSRQPEPQAPPTSPTPPATPVDPAAAKREVERWDRLSPAQQAAEKALARAKALADVARRERARANDLDDEKDAAAAAAEGAARDEKIAAKVQAVKDGQARAIAAKDAAFFATVAKAARSPAEVAVDAANDRLAAARKLATKAARASSQAAAAAGSAQHQRHTAHSSPTHPPSPHGPRDACTYCAKLRRLVLSTSAAEAGATRDSNRAAARVGELEIAVEMANAGLVAERTAASSAITAAVEADRWAKLTPEQQAAEIEARTASQERADAERWAKLTPEERARLAEQLAEAAKKVADEAVRGSKPRKW